MGDTPVHRLHPLAKIAAVVIYVTAVISFPPENISGLVPFCFFPAVLAALSGTPAGPLFSRFLLALPFSAMGGLSSLVLLRESVFTLGSFTVTAGMLSAFSILLKTFLTVMAVLVLAATTPFTEIPPALASAGLPRVLGLQFIMTWRYLSVLLAEAASMNTAYMLRSPGRRGIRMEDMGSFLGQLLLRSFDRAERVYGAMKSRGFDGNFHGSRFRRMRVSDCLFVLAAAAFSVCLRFVNAGLLAGRLFSPVLQRIVR
ncbi:MAG: cobalt ECF transporter T component CbiQ [Treponema sp.]|jgi:cobalt/nickel transport system permease protein|nr:cobalt ECF transporter T component CbiQ [Treponema sp.]